MSREPAAIHNPRDKASPQDKAVRDAADAVAIVTLYADGDELQVELRTPEARLHAPFLLPDSARRDLDGRPLELSDPAAGKNRGLLAVPGFGREQPTVDDRRGQDLFEALFPGRLHSLLDRARQRHGHLDLRLAWDVDEERLAELHRIPWELTSFPETAAPLALEPSLGLVRSPRAEVIRPPLEDAPDTLRVVAVAANPRGTVPLQLSSELEGLLALAHEDRAVEVVAAPNQADLHTVRRLVEGHQATVLHFMGHGAVDRKGSGVLLLEGAGGEVQRVTGEDLALALQGLDHLRLVVLNACRTAEAQRRGRDAVALRLIESGVPSVIAMQAPVPDSVAVAFSAELYGELARGRRLERAVCEARHGALARAPSTLGWAIPVLFSNVAGKTLAGLHEDRLPAPDRILRHRYLEACIEGCSRLDGDPRRGLKPRPLRSVFGRFRKADDRLIPEPLPSLLGTGPNEAVDADSELLWLWRRLRTRDPAHSGREATSEGLPDVLTQHRRMLWLGGPGSGKTQLLRWLTRQHAEAALAHRPFLRVPPERLGLQTDDSEQEAEPSEHVDLGPTRVPIPLDLLEFARYRRRHGPVRLTQWLGSETYGRFDPDAVRRFLLRELRRGRALLLADRLDEIVDPDERFAVAQEVAAFIRAFDAPSILAGRPLSCAPLALGDDEIRCFELEPLADNAVYRLGRDHGADDQDLHRLVARLHRDGADELVGNPLIVSVLVGLRSTERRLDRRLDIYGPIVEALLARYPRQDGAEALEKLAEIAAYLQDRPTSLGLLNLRRLREAFGELDVDPSGGLGPLQPLGSDTYSFIGRPIQEYLAARWLAAEVETLESRLVDRLNEPAWRRSGALAIGMAAEILEGPRLQELFQRLILHDQKEGQPVPAGCLLILAARPEIQSLGERVGFPWPELVGALLHRVEGRDPDEPLERSLIDALASQLRADALDPLDRALADFGRQRPDRVPALARIASAAPDVPVRLAGFLARNERSDPWLESALRTLYERDPSLHERGSVGRRLGRDELFAARISGSSTWRLVLRAVLGHPERPFRSSPLAEFFLDRITDGADAQTLGRELSMWADYGSEVKARHARLALTALGEAPPVPPAAVAGFHHDLERLRRTESPPPRTSSWTAPLLDSQRRNPEGLWIDLVRALADHLPSDRRLELLLSLAAASKESCKAPLLADFWRGLLWPGASDCASPDGDPVRRAAVVLDRYGRFLTSPVSLFVNVWIALGPSIVELPPVRGESLKAEHLAAALDVLAQIPDPFDFVRAWALAVLSPELRRHGLLDEAVILAETTLSDRLDALTTARRRLLGTTGSPRLEDLAAAASTIEDPWRRYRALNRLSLAANLRADWVENRLAPRHIYLSPATQAFYGITDPFRRLWAGLDVESPGRAPRSSDFPPKRVLSALAGISGLTPEQDPFVLAAMAEQARRATAAERTVTSKRPETRHDSLAPVERGELSPALVDGLLHQIDHADDLTRLRARLALHGDRSVLRRRWPVGRIGAGAIFRLAEHWLQRRYEPGPALVLRWTFEAVVHDRPDVLVEAARRAGRPGAGRRPAAVVLRFLETVSRAALPTVRELLHQGPDPARRALVRGLCNVMAVDDRAAAELRRVIVDDLVRAAPAFGERRVSIRGLPAVIDAASRALGAEDELAQAIRGLEATALPWAKLLTDDHALDHLHRLGTERRVGLNGERQVDREAKRWVEQPALLPLCVDWLLQRLNQSTEDGVDDLTTHHLIRWIASAARLRPRLYWTTVESRRGWVRRLAELAEHGVWLATRRSAIELLSLDRRLDDRRLRALWVASTDAPEVQRAALDSVAAYRRVDDPSILEPVEQALDHERPSIAYAAAGLLAALARPAYCQPRLRRRIEDRLRQAAGSPGARRMVHQLRIGARPTGLRIVEVGRLDHLLRGLLLDIQSPFLAFEPADPTGADP